MHRDVRFGFIFYQVMLRVVEGQITWQKQDGLDMNLTMTTQQPLIPGDIAILHADCRDTNIDKQDIRDLTMTFNLPYFLEYPQNGDDVISASATPSSIHTNTGHLVVQFTLLNQSQYISLDINLLVRRQDLVPNGSKSTSVGHVDVTYQRGSGSCLHSFNTHSDVKILVYKPDCENFGPLGIGNGGIEESQLSVSSVYQTLYNRKGQGPYRAGLNRQEYWAPAAGIASHDRRQYVQVDFRGLKDIKMISAQGHPESTEAIRSLQITTSNDGYHWKDCSEVNIKFYVTEGFGSRNVLLTAILKILLTTRWLRISPRFPNGLLGFRFEIYGCLSEKQLVSFEDLPLGMESGQIADNQISSSSQLNKYIKEKVRLNLKTPSGAWCTAANDTEKWLAVDLVTNHVITAVSSQCGFSYYGSYKLHCWRSFYLGYILGSLRVKYMENGVNKLFLGNMQNHVMVKHNLMKPIQSSKLIFHFHSDLSWPCLRVELYGRKMDEGWLERPVVFSRAFLVDTRLNRVFVCSTDKSRQKSHCYATKDGNSWTPLNRQLLTIHGLDKTGQIHGVSHNGKALLSCEQNGEGKCNVEFPDTWYKARDKLSTITAIEVPHIAEKGLAFTDTPQTPLIRNDSMGRVWGSSSRGIHLSPPWSYRYHGYTWKLVLTWRDYDFDECAECRNGGTCVIVDIGFLCVCLEGWTGHQCQTSIDDCVSNMCKNNATCVDKHLSYTCSCADGYTGTLCQYEIDECLSQPCLNGGGCTDKFLNYSCACAAGYTGINCETDIDECQSSPCEHGECVDHPGRYECVCYVEWKGPNCDSYDYCTNNNCSNGATCINGHNSYTCSCVTGWTGNDCESDIDECQSSPCEHGECVDHPGRYECVCYVEWKGPNCDSYDYCTNNNCSNGATCINGHNSYTCRCVTGWTGNDCESDIDECQSSPCEHGECVDHPGRHECVCYVEWKGPNCDSYDHCTNNNCSNGATCINGHNSYTCSCVTGWTGNDCESEIDPCVHYHNLTARNRRSTFYDSSSDKCDHDIISYPRAWYRFSKSAGSRMATICVPERHCGTHAPGWLNGTHPAESQGAVSMEVCFHRETNCCFHRETILVKNCSSFYAYELVRPALDLCPTRYCGE